MASGHVILAGTGDPSRSEARDWTGSGGELLGLLPGEMDDLPVQWPGVRAARCSRLGWRLPGGSDAMKPSTAASSDAWLSQRL